MQLMGAGVRHLVADPALGIARRGVPIGEHAGAIRPGAAADGIELGAIERRALHAAAIDLAAVALAEERAARLVALGRGADDEAGVRRQRRAHPERLAHMRAVLVGHDPGQEAVVAIDHRFLVEGGDAAGRIIARRHEIPDAGNQLHLRRHRICGGAVADPELEAAGRVDAEREAAGAVDRPAPEQDLAAGGRQGRVDVGVQRERSGRRQLALRIGDAEEVALLDVLLAGRPFAVDRRGDRPLDEAGPVGVLVAVDQPHELRPHAVRRVHARHHAQLVAGLHRKLVRVGGDADIGHRRSFLGPPVRIP